MTPHAGLPIVYLRGRYELDCDVGDLRLKRTRLTVLPGEPLRLVSVHIQDG